MFKTVKRLCEALECLTSSVEALRDMSATAHDFKAQSGNVEARVEELERSRVLFEASMQGELMLAKTEYRKAGSAEKRSQTNARNAIEPEDGAAESPEEFAERYQAWLRANHESGGDGLPALYGGVETPATALLMTALKARKRGR